MKRSLPYTLTPGRKIEAAIQKYCDKVSITGGVFGEEFDQSVNDEGDEGWSLWLAG